MHPHLFVSLDLGVDKSPQDVGRDGKIYEDQLRLLVEAEEREVVPQLHRLDGVLLLLETEKNIFFFQKLCLNVTSVAVD